MRSYSICFSLSVFFHLAKCPPGSSMFSQMIGCSFNGWIIFHYLYRYERYRKSIIFFIHLSTDKHWGPESLMSLVQLRTGHAETESRSFCFQRTCSWLPHSTHTAWNLGQKEKLEPDFETKLLFPKPNLFLLCWLSKGAGWHFCNVSIWTTS